MISAKDTLRLLRSGRQATAEALAELNKHEQLTDKQREIDKLKVELVSEDYKIIKASECNLVGKSCPYDMKKLFAKRSQLREQINALETDVAAINGGTT